MRSRFTVRTMALTLVLAVVAVALLSCTPSSSPPSTQQSGSPAGAPAAPTGTPESKTPMFPGLEGIPQDQLFDHFMGGQFNMTDNTGTAFTVHLTPGTVSSVITSSLTITPNGQTSTQVFNITPSTIVRAEPNPGTIQSIVPGDKVMVITKDTSMDAVMIDKHGAMYQRRMMQSMSMIP